MNMNMNTSNITVPYIHTLPQMKARPRSHLQIVKSCYMGCGIDTRWAH